MLGSSERDVCSGEDIHCSLEALPSQWHPSLEVVEVLFLFQAL
jgi:hypothetical protein